MNLADPATNSESVELQAVIDAALRLTTDEQMQLLDHLNARYFTALAAQMSAEFDRLLLEMDQTDNVLTSD